MNTLKKITLFFISTILATSCSFFDSSDLEKIKTFKLGENKKIEVKTWAVSRNIAEISYKQDFTTAMNSGYKELLEYFNGANDQKKKITFHEKLILKKRSGYLVRFSFSLRDYAIKPLSEIPQPLNKLITVRKEAPLSGATYSFSGCQNKSNFEEAEKKFREELKKEKVKSDGEATYLFGDSNFLSCIGFPLNSVVIPIIQ